MSSIYKSYDIRGKYEEELTVDDVAKIGKAIVTLYKPKKVAIGRDIRPSADILFETLARSITRMGADVVDLGLCTTPMSYFACAATGADVSIMITASHLPPEYNGLKITHENVKPATKKQMEEIALLVEQNDFKESVTAGTISKHALKDAWIEKFKKQFSFTESNLSLVIDPANMIGGLEIDTFKAFEPDLAVNTIYDTFDFSCPNHEANPIKTETMKDLGKEVVIRHANLGIAFDGDADRVGFVDEKGTPISSDIIGALLVRSILQKHTGARVVYDVRSSHSLPEEIIKNGGTAIREKVGHINIRSKMRECDAVLGIELSGHFFFKESLFSEGGSLPAFYILDLIQTEQKLLSQLVAEVTKYAHSGEINSEITESAEAIYTKLRNAFDTTEADYLDGLTLTEKEWWINIRPSGTEPIMRLNVEAQTKEQMEEIRDKALSIIRAST